MKEQIERKLKQGFHCIKLKWSDRLQQRTAVIRLYSGTFRSDQIEIRVDANGAFESNEALGKIAIN
jgi:L-alanine-DL-glutamate epimerase-like enolase superfamily enzyme